MLACRMISLAARVTEPMDATSEVAKTYVPMTITLRSDKANPDCTVIRSLYVFVDNSTTEAGWGCKGACYSEGPRNNSCMPQGVAPSFPGHAESILASGAATRPCTQVTLLQYLVAFV